MNLRIFGRNAILYALGTVCARAAMFLLIPLYTHLLPISDYGALTTLLITIQIMILVMTLGTQKGFIRFAADCEKEGTLRNLVGSTLATTFMGALLTGTLCMIFHPLLQELLHGAYSTQALLMAYFSALGQALFYQAISLFRARNEAGRYVALNVASLMLLAVMTYLFLQTLDGGVTGALAAQALTYGGMSLILYARIISRMGFGVSLPLARKLLQFSVPLLSATAWSLVIDTSSIYFLGYFRNLEEVALFSLGYKISQIPMIMLILPFQLAYEPFVFGNLDHPGVRNTIARLLTYLMLAYAYTAAVLVFLLRPLMPFIAPNAYADAYVVVYLMLPGIGFVGVYYVAESLMSVVQKTSQTGAITLAAAITAVLFNLAAIRLAGLYGAVAVFNGTMVVTSLLLLVMGIRRFAVPLEGRRLFMAGFLLIFFLSFVYLLRESPAALYYTIIPVVLLGTVALLYFLGFFSAGEKMIIRQCLRGVKQKVPDIASAVPPVSRE
jgi:O-antigen/teichoic acid export membrane protein